MQILEMQIYLRMKFFLTIVRDATIYQHIVILDNNFISNYRYTFRLYLNTNINDIKIVRMLIKAVVA